MTCKYNDKKCFKKLNYNSIQVSLVQCSILINEKKMGNKIVYYCPSCLGEVYAYSGFEGNTCWKCKLTKPFVNKGGWHNLMSIAYTIDGQSLGDFYNKEGDTVRLLLNQKQYNFSNALPKSSWQNLRQYKQVQFLESTDKNFYFCGLNAINMALSFWGYNRQMKKEQYFYKYFLNFRWGMSESDFYDYNVKATFDYHGYISEQAFGFGVNFNWGYINQTDYSKYCLIALGGYGLGAHYFIIIGVDQSHQKYLLTDQAKKVWVVEKELLRTASIYSNNGYSQHSLYKVG